jgi:hypothetical protein
MHLAQRERTCAELLGGCDGITLNPCPVTYQRYPPIQLVFIEGLFVPDTALKGTRDSTGKRRVKSLPPWSYQMNFVL